MASEAATEPKSEEKAAPPKSEVAAQEEPTKADSAAGEEKKADGDEKGEEKPKVVISLPDNPDSGPNVISAETVEATIESFTALDESGDKKAMNSLARRLGKDQPALLQAMAALGTKNIEQLGEAAVFYATLVWAVFEKHLGRRAARLLPQNISDAREIITKEMEAVEGIEDRPIYERVSPDLHRRQPYLLTRIMELVEEDIREEAIVPEAAAEIMTPTQIVVEAFHGAVTGERAAQNLDPIRREGPKVGRNDPCSCGSGKKFKRCCG